MLSIRTNALKNMKQITHTAYRLTIVKIYNFKNNNKWLKIHTIFKIYIKIFMLDSKL
jgi:hypothetical protein